MKKIFSQFFVLGKLMIIFIILSLCFTSKSFAQTVYDLLKLNEKPLENTCGDKDMNDGSKCYGLNDFLNQGYKIKEMTRVKEGTFIVYTLEQKSLLGKSKIILCTVISRSLDSFCKKP